MVERTLMKVDRHLEARSSRPASKMEAHPRASIMSNKSATSKKSSMLTTMSNFHSPARQTASDKEKQHLSHIAEDIEKEVKTALLLIHAQFKLHQINVESGTFYF